MGILKAIKSKVPGGTLAWNDGYRDDYESLEMHLPRGKSEFFPKKQAQFASGCEMPVILPSCAFHLAHIHQGSRHHNKVH
jgi:hypothetical protein